MPFCPNCGSYVSPGANVCSCGTTLGYSTEAEKERNPTEFQKQQEEKRKVRNGYYKKAEELMDDGKYLEAIGYIDRALEISNSGFYIKAKAKAYYYAGMYDEALPLFRQALNHYWGIDTYVIFEWIGDTLNELKRFDEAIEAYEEAVDVINNDYEKSVNFFKGERWMGYERIEHACASALDNRNERLSDVNERIAYSNRLKNETIGKISEISAESDLNDQKEVLSYIGRENLITITGSNFYSNPKFEKGMELKLIREEDNEFDRDAIAVYMNDVKVGYVVNNEDTSSYLTSKASEIQIQDTSYAEYMLYYAYRYHIARLTVKS